MKRARLATRSGFTILEVVLALAILLFGMAAILGMLTMGASLARTAEMRTRASTAIESVVADLEETLFPPSTSPDEELGPPRAITDRALPGEAAIVYSAKAVQNPARASEYRVDVELSWSSGGVRRERKFSTILMRELPFGERLRRRFVEHRTEQQPPGPEPTPPASATTPPNAPPK